MSPQLTKAGTWFDARREGRRLPAHEIPQELFCELCDRPATADDFNPVAQMIICPICWEGMVDARAYEPRCEAGLVGGGR